jgi:ribosomal protein L40E
MAQFENLRASTLYCRKCGAAMPVRERLLLVLPGREIHEYVCSRCGESVGKKETAAAGADARVWTP